MQLKKINKTLVEQLANKEDKPNEKMQAMEVDYKDLVKRHWILAQDHKLCGLQHLDNDRKLEKYRQTELIVEAQRQEMERLRSLADKIEPAELLVKRRRRWTEEDMSKAVAIYSKSPAAYQTLIKLSDPFEFPASSTIRKYIIANQIKSKTESESD